MTTMTSANLYPRLHAHSVFDVVHAWTTGFSGGSILDSDGNRLESTDVKRFAAKLTGAGVKFRDRVVVESARNLLTAGFQLAALSIGATVCPIDAQAPANTKRQIVAETAAMASVNQEGEVVLHDYPSDIPNRLRFTLTQPARVTGCDLALIVFTSGSSGLPKGIQLSHTNVMSALRAITSYTRLTESDRILSMLSMSLDYGIYQILFSLYIGCDTVIYSGHRDPISVVRYLADHPITVFPIIPALGLSTSKALLSFNRAIPSVRLVTNTGGHLPEGAIESLSMAFPSAEIMAMYGLTESKRALFLEPRYLRAKVGSVGKPMPGLDARVFCVSGTEEDGSELYREAETGEIGELFVRGASVMQGYLQENHTTGARLSPGAYRDDNWLATGDLFSRDEEGFLYFKGRRKSLIKQAGYCLYPRELENQIEENEQVHAAVVTSHVDSAGDEIAVLFVQLKDDREEPARAEFVNWIKRALPRELIPRRVQFVREWPATPNGKIDYSALVQTLGS